ncbi:hypothetical protein P691DRAFT_781544 [Macrolepiota fuliginosa MF-IS2]|uniref:Hydrophobin n=1 Tax=Macrolepiota fuliginosa MF-IS2 TaxID=1400762 RepID=A0A9P5XD01_9AGAR|nr:hypothetical protein P691DRAFT_781544 [Macrolepiota fuliginosa MF-IS2]
MIARVLNIFFALFLALPLLAAAAAAPSWQDTPPKSIVAPECNSGPVQCCDKVEEAHKVDYAKLSKMARESDLPFGIELGGGGGIGKTTFDDLSSTLVGYRCNPVTAYSAGGNKCNYRTSVCCKYNHPTGGYSLGCMPTKSED